MSKETRESTVNHEVLSVPSACGQPHTILITTTRTLTTFLASDVPQRLGTIELVAKYISGPLPRDRMPNKALVSKMGGDADTLNQRVKITNGLVMVDVKSLRGLGIGTYLFAKIVRWAIDFDPSLAVATIKAGPGDAKEDNQVRRNRFYSHFGIRFSDREAVDDVVAGFSLPMRAADLIPYDGWKLKVALCSVEERMIEMEDEHESLRSTNSDLTRCVQAKERALERRNDSKKQMFKFYGFIIMALGLALAWKW